MSCVKRKAVACLQCSSVSREGESGSLGGRGACTFSMVCYSGQNISVLLGGGSGGEKVLLVSVPSESCMVSTDSNPDPSIWRRAHALSLTPS